MRKETIEHIINEVYPKIVNHYGAHKGYLIPKVEVHTNIFARISGIKKMEGDASPSGEFCKDENKIDLIKALLHEYRHYLQPRWGYEFFNDMGFEYDNHPYELEAIAEESNYKNFIE